MKKHHVYRNRRTESGSALVYILIAIALLAALTVSFMQPSSQQTSSQAGFRTLTEVKSQVDVIRSGIQECVLRYPNGDQCINGDPSDTTCTGSTVTDTDALEEYPLKPTSTYLLNPKTGDPLARDIRCPGKNDGTDRNNHQPIFSGGSGKFLPPKPDLFGEWKYYNGTDGVFFWIDTDKSDSFLKTSMEKLEENYGDCEADTIDAVSSNVDLDVAGTVDCTQGSLCFRVWMVRKTSCP